MAKYLQIRLLRLFKEVGDAEDISGFLGKNFSKKTSDYRQEDANSVVVFLDEMEQSNYIKPLYDFNGAWFNEYINNNIVPVWSCVETDNRLWYYLTETGYQFKNQKFNWTLFWTIAGTLAAIIFGLLAFFKLDSSSLKKLQSPRKKEPAVHSSPKTKVISPKAFHGAKFRKRLPSSSSNEQTT